MSKRAIRAIAVGGVPESPPPEEPRPAFAVDTSCMIAAVCTWHERHGAVAAALNTRLGRGDRLVIPAHALVETYAVLTRLPAPHRLAPADAFALVKANFIDAAEVVTLDSSAHVQLLERLTQLGIGGGRSYDALIGSCADRAGVTELLTFNPRHYEAPAFGFAVVEPS